MSACSGTVLPLSFTEEIQTLEGVFVTENGNAKGLTDDACVTVLQVVYEKEQKGPVSTLAHINGFLLSAIGQKVGTGIAVCGSVPCLPLVRR